MAAAQVDHAAEAATLEAEAAKALREWGQEPWDSAEAPQMLAAAQAQATLALSHRTAEQNHRLAELETTIAAGANGIEGAIG